jgi:membrane protein YdbS with pleckstrin-like domain
MSSSQAQNEWLGHDTSLTKKQLIMHVLFVVLSILSIGVGITLWATLSNSSWASAIGAMLILVGLVGGSVTVFVYGFPWEWRLTEKVEKLE